MVYLSQSAQLTGGNVALEPAWDGKYNLKLICLVMKIGEISKVRITENNSTICEYVFWICKTFYFHMFFVFVFMGVRISQTDIYLLKFCLSNFYVDPCGLLFLTVFCSIPPNNGHINL